MELKKQAMTSASHSDFTLEALRQIAPSAFTEVRGEDGSLRHKVDFDALRELLGDDILDTDEERFGFHWVGKQAAKRAAAEPIRKTLRPIPEDSVDWDTTENLYIEGDNLEVLKLLQRAYLGKVKMIYIDPPYNTGKDFVYADDFAMSQAEEDEVMGNLDEEGNRLRSNPKTHQRYHSNWCSMIYSRLLVARTLLSNDGVIFISIDDNEVHHLRKICDEVFGESNFVEQFAIRTNPRGNQAKKITASEHEYILAYAKSITLIPTLGSGRDLALFNRVDSQGRYREIGLRKRGAGSLRIDAPNQYYPIYYSESTEDISTSHIDPVTDIIILPMLANGEDGRWRWAKESVEQRKKELLVRKVRRGSEYEYDVFQKDYYTDDGVAKIKSLLTEKEVNFENATEEQRRLFDSKVFDYPKPVYTIKKLIDSLRDTQALILDFFSGSATTAHAVMQLNAEDGGKRKYICVQLPEATPEGSEARKAGYETICAIGKERIRRAGKKIVEDKPEVAATLDTGFRVLRVDSSNMEDIYYAPATTTQEDLFSESVKGDRTELDLLFGCMVDWGVELSYPLRSEAVGGKRLHIVNDGALVACFDEGITPEVLRHIAELHPLRVIFRETCFSTDADKLNIYEQFKQLCGWSDDEAYQRIHVL